MECHKESFVAVKSVGDYLWEQCDGFGIIVSIRNITSRLVGTRREQNEFSAVEMPMQSAQGPAYC